MNRRDIPPEDRYGNGGGQSYRPGNNRDRSPRRPFDNRGPPRGRSRSPPPRDDFRRRSPSPRRPGPRNDFRGFRQSPPRRDDRGFRGNFRDDRGFNDRSPPRFRDRSPIGRGGRDSPLSNRGRRTPPGPRRDRTPPRRFDDHPSSRPQSPPRRPYSPPRGPARDFGGRARSPGWRQDERRQRSPSPRNREREFDNGGRDSIATSRRSSPPVHASRLALVQDQNEPRSGRPSPRSIHGDRDYRSPVRRHDSPPRRDKDGDIAMSDTQYDRKPVEIERSKDAEISRPPAGPSADRAPPTGPSAGASGIQKPAIVPPSGPRGDNSASRGGFASRGRGGSISVDFSARGRGAYPISSRGGRPAPAAAPSYNREPSYSREPLQQAPTPQGPRTFANPAPRPAALRTTSHSQRFDNSSPDTPAKDPRSAISTTQSPSLYRRPTDSGVIPSGPASDRMREPRRVEDNGVLPALRDLPEIIPGGKKLPPVVDRTRLNKLEEESEKLRRAIYEKDAKKRKFLREWEKLVREGESAALRSELAEEAVRKFETDGSERTAAAF